MHGAGVCGRLLFSFAVIADSHVSEEDAMAIGGYDVDTTLRTVERCRIGTYARAGPGAGPMAVRDRSHIIHESIPTHGGARAMTAHAINLREAASVARRAAEAPSARLFEIARTGSFRTSLKDDGSPQTSADTMAERLVRRTLQASDYPSGAAVLGEEEGETGQGSPWRWVVDPIDGTTAFARDIPVWGTLVALQCVETADVVAGAIRLPGVDETFWAWQGGGAWRNGERIHVAAATELSTATVAAGLLRQFRTSGIDHLLGTLAEAVEDMRIFGDVFAHAAAARGALDAVVDPDLSVWDFAASRIIVEEAGGIVLVRHTGRGRGHDVLLGAPAIVERLARLFAF